MKPITKALLTAAIVVVFVTVTIITASECTKDETIEIPEGNFTVLSKNIMGETVLTIIHDDDRNVTLWIYSGHARGGVTNQPDWMLALPNMSNNCNCS